MTQMNDQIEFSAFQLRGKRNYVHGTDIFSHMLAHLTRTYGAVDDLDMSFRSVTRRSLQLVISDEIPADANVKFSFRAANLQASGYLIETGSVISERTICLEDDILRKASLQCEKRQAVILNDGEFPMINCYVAMIKKLVLSITKAPNLWLGRLHLYGPVLSAKKGKLEVQVGVPSNLRILRSDISFDGHRAGEMFSLVKAGVS